jgi:hypothetical protein
MSIIYLGIGLMGLIKKRPESEWGFVLWFGQFGLAEMMLCLTEISNQIFFAGYPQSGLFNPPRVIREL